MRPPIDFSKDIKRKLAEGKSFDQALADLRQSGASIFDCIVSVRKLYRCEIAEAKLHVTSSPAWADVTKRIDDELCGLANELEP